MGIVSPGSPSWNTASSGGWNGLGGPLGLIPDPAEINRTLTGGGATAGLGIVPNDFQLAYHRQYLPVHHGWISDDEGGSLGSNSGMLRAIAGDIDPDQINKLVKAEKLKATMAVVSTGAVVLMALFGIFAYVKRED